VVKNTGFLYLRMAITIFISLYTTRVVLKELGIVDFGIFNLVAGFVAMLAFLNNSMTSASQRYISITQGAKDFQKLKQIFSASVVLHLIIGIIILIILEGAGMFFFNNLLTIPTERIYAAKIIFHFSVVSTLFTIISVPYDAVINSHENMFLVAVLGVLETLLKLVSAMLLIVYAQDKLVFFGFGTAIISILLLIIRRIYCHKKYAECKIKIFHFLEIKILKEMSKFASWSLLTSSTSIISNYGLGVIINIFFGPVLNAAQGIASQVNGQLSTFSSTMLKAINPVLVKSEGAGDRAGMLKISMVGSKFSFFLLAMFAIPAIVEMPYILGIWLKEVPEYAVSFCRLQLFTSLFLQMFVLLASTISAQGNIASASKVKSFIIIAPLPILYFIFKYTSADPNILYGVVVSFHAIREMVNLYFAKKNCDLKIGEFFRNVVFKALGVLAFMLVFTAIPALYLEEGFVRLAIVLMISTLTFVTSLLIFGLTKAEKNQFSVLIQSIKTKLF
jgi:Na+-driven multidrug efflux pump